MISFGSKELNDRLLSVLNDLYDIEDERSGGLKRKDEVHILVLNRLEQLVGYLRAELQARKK